MLEFRPGRVIVSVSAYLDKTSDTLAIVAINHNDSEVNLTLARALSEAVTAALATGDVAGA